MKKLLGLLTVVVVALVVFGIVSKRADANKTVFSNGSQDDIDLAKQISLDILRDRASRSAIGNPDEYQIQKVEIDELRMAHTRVRQTVGGIPVWEGEAIVHLKSDGTLSTITDSLKEAVSVNTTPNFSEKEALRFATSAYSGKAKITDSPQIEMFIYRGGERDHLVYRVETPRLDGSPATSAPVKFIDAQTGDVVFEYDNLQTGSGSSLYSGTVTIDTSNVGTTYYMEDLTRKMGTFNMNNTGSTSTGTGGTQSRYSGTDDIWSATNERAGVDAHWGARWTYDYFLNVHGRNGINGSGGPGTTAAAANSAVSLITSRVHFGSNYNNAFWYQNKMTYGDGNGTTFSPLTTVDIAGHEMTHGVTQYSANLTYSNESGALNESMSDVFGAMTELYSRGGTVTGDTWKIGEQSYTPATSGDALRYMDNPHLAGNGGYTSNDDPDHYTERYTGTADSGGVHINSGIPNHAYYLAAAGGTHHLSGVTVTGIGTTDAAKIWYRALTVYMTSGTNFAAARTAMLNAATDLFGASSAQYNTIATTWCAVGVGTCPGGSTPTPTPTPTPSGNELIVNGGFEASASPWVGSGSGYFYTAAGNSPHGGTGYIYFGVNNSVTGQSYQTVTIPSTATGTMTFWLNVTSSETTTTTQYDKLFVEVRNTAGTLLSTLATYSNLNKTTQGNYSQKSLNVAAYKGQTVRIQFRSTMDSSITSTFRVDDVSVK
ncbi:MAG: M4 family metallopeptidase [Pyrinomonadaceae bacterium]|nr:M4 family metallopeptidase [Pyrinomonadaceae bacterium]MBP6213086.1 M4 family metallopeptidase [Pyrinomonadaceae bacterium]